MERINKKQHLVISALITERTMEDAARKAGIGKTTIFRWLQDEAFQNAYRQARSEIVRHAITQAQNACSEAITVLKEIMSSKEAPASTRVSAAKVVLETSIKAVELEDIIARIEKIETHLNSKDQKR